ncbi:hypothetical protein AAFF_G00438270 [Aldrovandia affinis]|uniref:Secreted protein n=1 Tax=Aldrovandia affinis TaxID=143900 RepID=A0AAD7SA24_9TELE|nr:hypothetical protein AAFF_G00438270 [Aldrovandia affinis]
MRGVSFTVSLILPFLSALREPLSGWLGLSRELIPPACSGHTGDACTLHRREGASAAGLRGNAHYSWISASEAARAQPLRTGAMGIVWMEIRAPELEAGCRMLMVQKSH